MRKILFILVFGLTFLACSKTKNEPPVNVKELNQTNLSGAWKCVGLNSKLIGSNKEIIDDINKKLNAYQPIVNLSFTIFSCSFIFFEDQSTSQKDYPYDIKNKQIEFDVKSLSLSEAYDNTLRAGGSIVDDTLRMSFSKADFEILTWILEDYPYNKALLNEAKVGDVELTFNKIK